MDIKEFVMKEVANAFGVEKDTLTLETSLLEDLKGKSVNYFPLMNALEEEYDLELDYQPFRSQCITIGDIVNMVEEEA